MKQRLLWCALAAVAALAPVAAAADLILTGTVTAGTYTRTNEDIYIYDATLAPGPGGITTLTLVAHNGKIVVGNGPVIPGNWGIDARGADGIDGWTFWPPQAGQPGTAGKSVSLSTDTLTFPGSPARDRGIYIGKPIDCSGGDGGDGANGIDGHFDDCAYIDAEPGYTARTGQPGGTITISGAGDIAVTGSLDVSGGNGGWGGAGGGGIIGPGGNGRPGGDGGKAGSVTITQTNFAPATSYVSFYVNYATSGSIAAYGGSAGFGGSGGGGHGPHPGGNGGNGAPGGTVKITAKNFSMSAAQGACIIGTGGGYGGAGGNGGGGASSNCVEIDCSTGHHKYSVGGFGGANSGSGGKGGGAGPITISSADQFGMGLNCGLSAHGGNGASSGVAGNGGVGMGDLCDDGEHDCAGFIAYGPGQTFPSGAGGAGGAITVTTKTLSMSYYFPTGETASMDSGGGDGGDGVDGSTPGMFCCGDPAEPHAGHGGQGGAGGAGGSGANITLAYTVYFVTNEPYYYCGGQGYQGGNGSWGQPSGPGGIGGACGVPGKLIKNGVVQPSPCGQCPAITGQQGGPLPPCIIS